MRGYLLVMLLFLAAVHSQAPVNDACAGAIDITASSGSLVNTNLNQATREIPPPATPCQFYSTATTYRTVWFTFTSGSNNYASINFCDGSVTGNPALYLFSGTTCAALTCVTRMDQSFGCGNGPAFEQTILRNTKYYLIIGGTATPSPGTLALSFLFQLRNIVAATNGLCTSATPITSGQTVAVASYGVVASSVSVTCSNTFFAYQWYSFNSGLNNVVAASFCGQPTRPLVDTVLQLMLGPCGGSCIAEADDSCETGSFLSQMRQDINRNTNYLLAVSRFKETPIDISFTFALEAVVANDLCANSQTISGSSVPSVFATTIGANNEGDCAVPAGTVYFKFNSGVFNTLTLTCTSVGVSSGSRRSGQARSTTWVPASAPTP